MLTPIQALSKTLRQALIGLATAAATLAPAMAADEQESAPSARIARLAVIEGAVSFAPAGTTEWLAASPSHPLTQGDQVWVDKGGRAELRIGSTALRMDNLTELEIADLSDSASIMSLGQGTFVLRVRQIANNDRLEIESPNLALSIRSPGEYRITVDPDRDTTTISVRQGEARVFANQDGPQPQIIYGNQRVTFSGKDLFRVSVGALGPRDEFERWSAARDYRDDNSRSARYVSREMTGYEDLDDNGEWDTHAEYGAVWYPRVTIANWAPYQYGRWVWVAPWGWTWVDDQRWGFAPFHYGRWARVGPRWGWVPGPIVPRPVYAPAMVGFVGGSNGSFSWGVSLAIGSPGVAWFPLAPREVYRPVYTRNVTYINQVNVIHNHQTTIVNPPRHYQHQQHAVAMPAQDFVRGRAAHENRQDIRADQRRDIANMPVSGGLAVAPVRASITGESRPGHQPPPSPAAAVARQISSSPARNDDLARRFAQENGTVPGTGPAYIAHAPASSRNLSSNPNSNPNTTPEQNNGRNRAGRNDNTGTTTAPTPAPTNAVPPAQQESPRMRPIDREIGQTPARSDNASTTNVTPNSVDTNPRRVQGEWSRNKRVQREADNTTPSAPQNNNAAPNDSPATDNSARQNRREPRPSNTPTQPSIAPVAAPSASPAQQESPRMRPIDREIGQPNTSPAANEVSPPQNNNTDPRQERRQTRQIQQQEMPDGNANNNDAVREMSRIQRSMRVEPQNTQPSQRASQPEILRQMPDMRREQTQPQVQQERRPSQMRAVQGAPSNNNQGGERNEQRQGEGQKRGQWERGR